MNTLIGHNNPSGRLPYTLYPVSYNLNSNHPCSVCSRYLFIICEQANMTQQRKINDYDLRSHEGLTYQWYTGALSGPALHQFGEGLSYTRFIFTWHDPPPTSVSTTGAHDELQYSVKVKNVGQRDGATAVLAFVVADGRMAPLRKLVGF